MNTIKIKNYVLVNSALWLDIESIIGPEESRPIIDHLLKGAKRTQNMSLYIQDKVLLNCLFYRESAIVDMGKDYSY